MTRLVSEHDHGARARKPGIARDHAVLQLHCAAHGVRDASELDEDAVSGPVDDATVMHGNGGIDQIASESRSRARIRSSSAPASLLYPTTSAARMAASFRVSAMAVPSPHARLARLSHWPV